MDSRKVALPAAIGFSWYGAMDSCVVAVRQSTRRSFERVGAAQGYRLWCSPELAPTAARHSHCVELEQAVVSASRSNHPRASKAENRLTSAQRRDRRQVHEAIIIAKQRKLLRSAVGSAKPTEQRVNSILSSKLPIIHWSADNRWRQAWRRGRPKARCRARLTSQPYTTVPA